MGNHSRTGRDAGSFQWGRGGSISVFRSTKIKRRTAPHRWKNPRAALWTHFGRCLPGGTAVSLTFSENRGGSVIMEVSGGGIAGPAVIGWSTAIRTIVPELPLRTAMGRLLLFGERLHHLLAFVRLRKQVRRRWPSAVSGSIPVCPHDGSWPENRNAGIPLKPGRQCMNQKPSLKFIGIQRHGL